MGVGEAACDGVHLIQQAQSWVQWRVSVYMVSQQKRIFLPAEKPST